MRIDIWSDVVCPWCFIGKRRLEAALSDFDADVDIRWHSFELDPNAAKSLDIPLTEALAKKYGMTRERALQMQTHVTTTAAEDGIEMRFDIAKTGNTLDAHRLIHFAYESDLGDVMKERLLLAYFTEGRAISDRDELASLAGEVGLDTDAVAAMLASDAFTQAVRDDEAQARTLGATGVPFFVIDQRYGISGAQPAATLLQALNQAHSEAQAKEIAAGEGCDADGCEIPA
jgi:predicted DsbA family dithiol-disulfide isomerase